jgi:hypothetical protein
MKITEEEQRGFYDLAEVVVRIPREILTLFFLRNCRNVAKSFSKTEICVAKN